MNSYTFSGDYIVLYEGAMKKVHEVQRELAERNNDIEILHHDNDLLREQLHQLKVLLRKTRKITIDDNSSIGPVSFDKTMEMIDGSLANRKKP